jgi:hypothetical protein
LPASWADEIHFQSRYPVGFSVTYGAASSSAFPDAGAIEAATPTIVATETSKKAIPLIVAPFKCDFYTSFAAGDRKSSLSRLKRRKGVQSLLSKQCGNQNVSRSGGKNPDLRFETRCTQPYTISTPSRLVLFTATSAALKIRRNRPK